jgi:hypothetical protein
VACVVCVAINYTWLCVVTDSLGMYGSVECSGLHLLRTCSVFMSLWGVGFSLQQGAWGAALSLIGLRDLRLSTVMGSWTCSKHMVSRPVAVPAPAQAAQHKPPCSWQCCRCLVWFNTNGFSAVNKHRAEQVSELGTRTFKRFALLDPGMLVVDTTSAPQ